MNSDLFQKMKVDLNNRLSLIKKSAKENKALTWQKSLMIPHTYKSNFRKEGRFIICPTVIIRPTMDYSIMANIYYAGI